MAKLELKKAMLIDGEEKKEIEYDLEDLTGADLQQAVKELGKRGIVVTVTETDQNYHAMLFSIASGLAYEDLQRMTAKDYMKACNEVRDFFLAE